MGYSPAHWQSWWRNPREVQLYQFMGKDNIFFHTVIFPACLLGTGRDYTLLHHVSTTEYLNYEGGKFSKSRGTGVFGDQAQRTGIPPEVWRYYLLANRPEQSDSIFTWADFAAKVNDELNKNLGNFVQRTLSLAFDNFEGATPGERGARDERDAQLVAEADRILAEFNAAMEEVKLKAGLRLVMELSAAGNAYVQHQQPWALAKPPPAETSASVPVRPDLVGAARADRLATVMALAVSLVRTVAACAEPFMPGFADKVAYQLDLPHMDIPSAFAVCVEAGHKMAGKPTPLFSPILDDRLAELRAQFGGHQEQTTQAPAAARGAPTAAASASGSASASASASASGSASGSASSGPLEAISECDFRVGLIERAWKVEGSDKLYGESVNVGEAAPREIASGLQSHVPLEQMAPRRVVIVANLKPRKMGSFLSNGMVLCVSVAGGETRARRAASALRLLLPLRLRLHLRAHAPASASP